MRRSGFTFIELIFVIVVMGILAKFGVEFLNQAYSSFIASSINNTLQAQSAAAVESVASRLQYRIKDSVIGRKSSDASFLPIGSSSGDDFNILEWVATDIENLRGNSTPNWSGIIDLYHPSSTSNILVSPGTDTTAINTMIQVLSHNSGTTINDAALYFIGSDSDIISGYGWDGNVSTINTQNGAMHPINSVGGQPTQFAPAVGNFSGVDVFEYYQLAWTAYAVGISNYNAGTNTGTLMLYYDYQPWKGEIYTNGKSEILMENVSTFQFKSIGSIVKIQVCVNSEVVEDYSLCKEKTIY